MPNVKLVEVGKFGKIFFRPLSDFQPDSICRTCGRSTSREVTTQHKCGKHGIAMPCCENQWCYDGADTRTVIDQIWRLESGT